MSDHILDVAKDFSEKPFGRYRTDGERSAEVFREDFLIPAMREHEHVTVDLSGTLYYGSSFLEETFGGLVREILLRKKLDIPADKLDEKLTIVHSKLRSIEKEARGYIANAVDSAG